MQATLDADALRKKSMTYYINSVITIVIMFGFGQLPAPAPITPLGMQILGIFLALLFGWTFVDQVWPSILGFIALSLTGYAPLAGLMKEGFFISRKLVLGKPWLLIFTFFFVVFLMSAMTSSVPVIVVGWGILYCILNQLGYKAGDPLSSYMVVGVVYSSLVGLALFPWKVLQMVVLGMFANTAGYQLEYSLYISLSLPISIASIIGYVLLGKFLFRLDVEKLKLVTKDSFDPKDLQINYQQKIIISMLVLLVVLLVAPSIMPKAWAVTKILRGIGAHGVAFLILGVFVFLRFGNKAMINLRKASSDVQWDCIFLTAAMLPFTTALNAESTGINAFLIEKFSLIFNGLSPLVFIFLVIVITMIATQFMNNAICGAIMFSIVYPFAVAIGINPAMITVLMIFCLALAMLTPAGSPMSALMFGNSEWISAKEIYRYVVPGVIVIFICVCVVGIPMGFLIF